MRRSEVLFTLIDVLFDPLQNYRRYPGTVREKKIVYDETDPKHCKAEYYYLPELLKGDKKMPVIMNIHGGGFVKGDMKHRRSLCRMFAKQGYFVYNINYHCAPKFPYPKSIIDSIKALNYLNNVAEKYNIDLEKVCVTGDSSGAWHASQLVAHSANPVLSENIGAPDITVKPAVFVGFCGPYDMVSAIENTHLPFNTVWDIGNCFVGRDFGLKKDFSNINDYKYIKQLSPTNSVNEKWCPSFIVMSEKDFFCPGHGDILAGKLRENGVEVETYTATRFIDNHCFQLNFWTKASKESLKESIAFMDKHLKA